MRTQTSFFAAIAAVATAACHSSDATAPTDAGVDVAGEAAVAVSMRFTRAAGLYDAPLPSDDLRHADGTVDLSKFPNPNAIDLMNQVVTMASASGFSTSGGVFFQLTGSIDGVTLPTLAESITPTSGAFLLAIDPTAPDYQKRYPVVLHFDDDGGPFGSPNMLSLLPLQGVPLRPNERYAAVVTTAIVPGISPEMQALASGAAPDGMSADVLAEYTSAISEIAKVGTPSSALSGVAVFTTSSPTDAIGVMKTAIHALPVPAPDAPWTANEVFDGYCVYSTTLKMPDFQHGTAPYTNPSDGGGWQFDATGTPVFGSYQETTLTVTIPRSPMPPGGYPLVVFIQTGAGGLRALVDRGAQATNGGPPITPGSGPAQDFAAVGMAGLQLWLPLEGTRNPSTLDEDFAIVNVSNILALRDNFRESALELTITPDIAKALAIDVSKCPGATLPTGATTASLDTTKLALFGHSLGAWIAPLALAWDDRFQTAILSGAGGSWIENVIDKQMPVDVAPLVAILLGYPTYTRSLTTNDIALTLFQWAAEPSDPMVYDRRIVREVATGESPRNVLMVQGIVDHYILPSIADATSLPLGLDLAGPALDSSAPELADEPWIVPMLAYSGRSQISLPASGNVTSPSGPAHTAVLVQHLGDAIEDGHEVIFQTEAPKHQYRCFLASWLAGATPKVPVDDAEDAPCPP